MPNMPISKGANRDYWAALLVKCAVNLSLALAVTLSCAPVRAQDTRAAASDLADPAPTHGHSLMGDVFNEGPRQRAYLMKGTGSVHFPITTRSRAAQRFFDQGVGQLHGFWYFEAERSFREVSVLDPDCAAAYWGMAMANTDNEERARGFIEKAKATEAPRELLQHLDDTGFFYNAKAIEPTASPREVAYINALAAFLKPGQDDGARKLTYANALGKIAHD